MTSTPTKLTYVLRSLILITILLVTTAASTSVKTCHELVGKEALNRLATKRHYHFDPEEASGVTYTPEGCQAEKLWYFGRHGTRYPGTEDIEAMQTLLPLLHQEILAAGNTTFCPQTLEYFSTWIPNPNLNTSTESYLTPQGFQEISLLSSRFIKRYPHLYPNQFSNASYHFKFTNSQRTEASTHSFATSIFGSDKLDTVWFPEPLSKDPILKFYSLCEKWEEEVDEGVAGSKEHDDFVIGEVMSRTIDRVSGRLGIGRRLTVEEVTTVYTTCGFESAWSNGTISQWCALFDLEDLTVMEYREDLEYFWKDGYGFEINWKQACPPFKDAIQFFDESPRKVQVYYSHSGATLKMFARLGLFNGNGSRSMEIRADNFEEMRDIYEWRTSKIDFMASNMAFVMYTCNNTQSQKQIGLFTQELPTPFPACGNKAFCSYEQFKSALGEFTNDCDLEEICRV